MQLELSSDQEFFRETTARFLADQAPVYDIRDLGSDPQGYRDDYWRRGAELGWTSLLVDEARGGGSISGEIDFELSQNPASLRSRALMDLVLDRRHVATA